MKMRGQVIAVVSAGEKKWTGAKLYTVTVAATDDHDNRVSEIHVDERTARALPIGRRVEIVLRVLP